MVDLQERKSDMRKKSANSWVWDSEAVEQVMGSVIKSSLLEFFKNRGRGWWVERELMVLLCRNNVWGASQPHTCMVWNREERQTRNSRTAAGRVHALFHPSLVRPVWQSQRNPSYGTQSPGESACPSSCSSPPQAQVLIAPIDFPFSVLEVEVVQSFLLQVTDLKNHHETHKVWY